MRSNQQYSYYEVFACALCVQVPRVGVKRQLSGVQLSTAATAMLLKVKLSKTDHYMATVKCHSCLLLVLTVSTNYQNLHLIS